MGRLQAELMKRTPGEDEKQAAEARAADESEAPESKDTTVLDDDHQLLPGEPATKMGNDDEGQETGVPTRGSGGAAQEANRQTAMELH